MESTTKSSGSAPEDLSEWLEQCPVQETDPELDDTESLIPGEAIINCSGDIHLQRGATKKSKYLVLLPGLLSFNEKTKDDSKSVVLTQETEQTLLSQETESGDVDEDNKGASQGDQQGLISLGTMEGLASERPTLSLPFPSTTSKVLQMSGRQINTSSRFLVLSVKKGKVTCKHIFDSAVVFGSPVIAEGKSPDGEVDFADDSDSDCDEKVGSINHYGCSVRHLQNGVRSIGGMQQTTIQSGHIPGQSRAEGYDEDDSTSEPESAIRPEETMPKEVVKRRTPRRETKKTVKYDESSSEGDDNTSDDSIGNKGGSEGEEHKGSADASSSQKQEPNVVAAESDKSPPEEVVKRRTPRRETKKTIKYDEESSEEGDDANDDSSEGEEHKGPVRPSTRKRKAGDVAPKSDKRRKVVSVSEQQLGGESSDEDENREGSSFRSDSESSEYKEKRMASPRTSRTSKRTQSKTRSSASEMKSRLEAEVLVLSSDDNEDDKQSGSQPVEAQDKRKRSIGEDNSSVSSNDENGNISNGKKRKQMPLKQTAAMRPKKGGQKESPLSTATSSPRRRRRSSQGKSASKKTTINLADEDGLDFLQS